VSAGPRCPYCGQPLEVVQVHGHGQCRRCGINIDPCCGGECAMTPDARAEAARGDVTGSR